MFCRKAVDKLGSLHLGLRQLLDGAGVLVVALNVPVPDLLASAYCLRLPADKVDDFQLLFLHPPNLLAIWLNASDSSRESLSDSVSNARAIAWAICCSSSVMGINPFREMRFRDRRRDSSFTCLVHRLHTLAAEVGAANTAAAYPEVQLIGHVRPWDPLAIIAVPHVTGHLHVTGHDDYPTPASRPITDIGIFGGNKAVR